MDPSNQIGDSSQPFTPQISLFNLKVNPHEEKSQEIALNFLENLFDLDHFPPPSSLSERSILPIRIEREPFLAFTPQLEVDKANLLESDPLSTVDFFQSLSSSEILIDLTSTLFFVSD